MFVNEHTRRRCSEGAGRCSEGVPKVPEGVPKVPGTFLDVNHLSFEGARHFSRWEQSIAYCIVLIAIPLGRSMQPNPVFGDDDISTRTSQRTKVPATFRRCNNVHRNKGANKGARHF